jgi:hypothetical protein
MSEPEDMKSEKPENVKEKDNEGFFTNMLTKMENKYPKIMEKLKDIRIQAVILFFIMAIFYINLIIWDYYFSPDSMNYGLQLKNWFEGDGIPNRDLYHPAHPLTMPIAIMFTHLMMPLIGSNYLLSYSILDAILGAGTVAAFYLVCYLFAHNRKYSLICSMALAFSFAVWENFEVPEDRALGFIMLTLYIPLLFAFMGEIKPFKWFEALKTWQKGLITGIFMGFVISAHFSFVLLFLFSLMLGWRYYSLKFFKSSRFIWFMIGAVLVCGIVFGLVAYALEVDSVSGFIGMFTRYHTGEGSQQFFALSNPETLSFVGQFQRLPGGVFTAFLMFISEDPMYKGLIIIIGGIILMMIAYMLIHSRKNKVVSSFFILYAIWFAHFFFFSPDERASWHYMLVPVWLSVCIGMTIMKKEGVRLMLLKRRLPEKVTRAVPLAVIAVVLVLLLNNIVVIGNAHFNHDEKEKFVQFVDKNVTEDDAIIIVDDSTGFFVGYFSDKEAINFRVLVIDSEVSDYINESFNNGTAIYLGEFWLLDSYIPSGDTRAKHLYESRLEEHREIVAMFNSMYEYELAYPYEWSDVYIITGLK